MLLICIQDFGMLSMKIEVHISDPYGNLTKMELRIKNFLKQQTVYHLICPMYSGTSLLWIPLEVFSLKDQR